jgi:hypothetical protein
VNARSDKFQQGAIDQILQQASPEAIEAIGGLNALTNAIRDAASGLTRTIIVPGTGTGSSGGSSKTPASPS